MRFYRKNKIKSYKFGIAILIFLLLLQHYWSYDDNSWFVRNSMGEAKREGREAVGASHVCGRY